MRQYLNEYRYNPTLKNAQRLTAYVDRHPMATLFATSLDLTTLEAAKNMVEEATFTQERN